MAGRRLTARLLLLAGAPMLIVGDVLPWSSFYRGIEGGGRDTGEYGWQVVSGVTTPIIGLPILLVAAALLIPAIRGTRRTMIPCVVALALAVLTWIAASDPGRSLQATLGLGPSAILLGSLLGSVGLGVARPRRPRLETAASLPRIRPMWPSIASNH